MGTSRSKEFISLDPTPSEADLQPALDYTLADRLRSISLGVGILFASLTIIHLLLQPKVIALQLMAVSAITALAALGLHLYLRRRALLGEYAHPVAAIITAAILVNFLLQIYLTGSAAQTTSLLLLIVAVGFVLLSTNWLLLIFILTGLGWALVVWALPAATDWLHYGFSMAAACTLSYAIHRGSVLSLRQMERMHRQDQRSKSELGAVLSATEKAQRSLATNMAVGQRITSILDLKELLTQVAELIQTRFGYYAVSIFLLDSNHQNIVLQAVADKTRKAATHLGLTLKVGEQGIIGWVAQHHRPARIDDVTLDQRYMPVDYLPNTRSELAIPLEMGREMLGVLDLQSDRLAAFSEEDEAFLQTLADQVAIAIHNASTYQVEKSRRRLAENLYDIGRALSGTLDLAEELDLILKYLSEIVPYDRASLMMREGESLHLAAERGFPQSVDSMRVAIHRHDVFQEIYRTQKPLAIADIPNDRPDWTNIEDLPPARSWLGIPLIHSDAVMGMLSLVREKYQPYTQDEIALASTFAGQASLALRNAQLYDQIRRFNVDLENLVKQRTAELQTAYDTLHALDRAKSDFIGIASHELRTPLTVIQGYAQMLGEEPPVRSNDQYMRLIGGIQSGTRRLLEIIESMLDVAKIDNRELHLYPSPVPISSLVHFVIESLREALKERQITLTEDLQALPAIEADVDALRKVFYHLIVNAIKYTPDGGSVQITGRMLNPGEYDLPGKNIEVVISDTGIGIDASMQQLIFAKFYQTGRVAVHSSGKTKFKGGGPGLGLAIAKGVVEAHHGKIWVESSGHDETNYPGSRFYVVLPIHQSTPAK